MDISLAIHHFNLKSSVCIHKVLLQGSVSQTFILGPRFYFMSKNGQLFALFSNINFYIQQHQN